MKTTGHSITPNQWKPNPKRQPDEIQLTNTANFETKVFLSLHHNVFTIREVIGSTLHVTDIPVEVLRVTQCKRIRVIALLLCIFFLLFGTILIIAATADMNLPAWGTTILSVVLIVVAGLSLCHTGRRKPVVEFEFSVKSIELDDNFEFCEQQKIACWMPADKKKSERVKELLEAIEASRKTVATPLEAGVVDATVIKSMPPGCTVIAMFLFFSTLLLILFLNSIEKPWLLTVCVVFGGMLVMFGIYLWRQPPLLKKAERHERRHQLEDALECCRAYEAQSPANRDETWISQIDLLLKMGRYDDAVRTLGSHSDALTPESYETNLAYLRLFTAVRFRKKEPIQHGNRMKYDCCRQEAPAHDDAGRNPCRNPCHGSGTVLKESVSWLALSGVSCYRRAVATHWKRPAGQGRRARR